MKETEGEDRGDRTNLPRPFSSPATVSRFVPRTKQHRVSIFNYSTPVSSAFYENYFILPECGCLVIQRTTLGAGKTGTAVAHKQRYFKTLPVYPCNRNTCANHALKPRIVQLSSLCFLRSPSIARGWERVERVRSFLSCSSIIQWRRELG